MQSTRRTLLLGATASGLCRSGRATTSPGRPSPESHDMSAFPASWTGRERIAMLLYPEFTALDLTGPQYMFANLMGAKVHLVAATRDAVRSDTGVTIVPDMRMEDCPSDLDILFVPGGSVGTLKAMQDSRLVNWIAEQARTTSLVASVCTGSMLLGQAGLLRGRRATSHWATHEILSAFGAIPVHERVVWDGKFVTGAGVSAGLDLGLAIVARLRDPTYAQSVQLLAEYAPAPPFDAGTPERAPGPVRQMMNSMFDGLRDQMKDLARHAR